MSHYAVLVVGEDFENQLAPFQENNGDNVPREYLEFQETETEMREDYENGSSEMVVLADGTMKSAWDSEFEFWDGGKREYKYPEGSETREVPHKERFSTFEEFASKYWNTDSRDADEGQYGYWHNPNAKWDWWSVGGRWSGFFKLKPDADGVLGKRGVFAELNNEPDNRAGRADQAYKRDIDFEGMKQEARQEAEKLYDKFEEFKAKYPDFKGWSHFNTSMEIDEAREAYRSQAGKDELEDMLGFRMGCWADVFSVGREKYVKSQEESAYAAFAVLKDGEWYERGEMGWWGIVSNEKEGDDWNAEFSKLIDDLPDDTLLTLVDCHI